MTSPFLSVAVTGGIATGKSIFTHYLHEEFPAARRFDCDACVHELLTMPAISRSIIDSLGTDVTDSAGQLDRQLLREKVFHDPESKRTLESILHPLVREQCQLAREQAEVAPGVQLFLMEVPLLYESGFPVPRDLEVVVACGSATQRERLLARSRLTPALADRIIASQLALSEKMARAGTVIWNGAPLPTLRRHTLTFSTWLKSKLTP